MDPVTASLIAGLAPEVLKYAVIGLGATFAWLGHRTHNQTVQVISAQGAQTTQAVAAATAQAVVTAIQSGTPAKDLGKVAGAAAIGAAVAALPQITVQDPAAPKADGLGAP